MYILVDVEVPSPNRLRLPTKPLAIWVLLNGIEWHDPLAARAQRPRNRHRPVSSHIARLMSLVMACGARLHASAPSPFSPPSSCVSARTSPFGLACFSPALTPRVCTSSPRPCQPPYIRSWAQAQAGPARARSRAAHPYIRHIRHPSSVMGLRIVAHLVGHTSYISTYVYHHQRSNVSTCTYCR